MTKAIGPSFLSELETAGLTGLPFAWNSAGTITFSAGMTDAQIAAVEAVYTAHDPAKPAPPPTTITSWEFLSRFTVTERHAVQQACLANAAVFLPLTEGLASGAISLTDPLVQQWMQTLVNASAITSDRLTAILTP